MKLSGRHLGYLVVLAALGGIAALMLQPDVLPVETASATVGPLEETITDAGESRVRHRHIVTAPVAGRLEPISYQAGDSVVAGTVVARLSPLPLDARSRQLAEATVAAARDRQRAATAELDQARAAAAQAERDRQRAEQLLAGGALAPAQVEHLRLAERTARRTAEATEAHALAAAHDVEAARAALVSADAPARSGMLSLVCPVGGRILQVHDRSSRTVQPGEPLMEVGDPGDLEIVVDLLSSDAVRAQPGQRMRITGWGRDSALAATVRRVDPSGFTKVSALGVEEQRVNVVGELAEVPAGMGDRFRLDVHIVLWHGDSVLQVPSSALYRRGEQWALFAVEDGRAREREVVVGHESSSHSEILSGLEAGEVVIRHPSNRISDGVRVRRDP